MTNHNTNNKKKFVPITDPGLENLKSRWFSESQTHKSVQQVLPKMIEWFRSSKKNTLLGWDDFPYTDMTLGNTHYIESIASKYKWNFQVLHYDYAYYNFMGKIATPLEDLKPGVPLMISLPNWNWADIRPDWQKILATCEQKNIDIHIDCAWIILAKNIELDFSHPNIKSFAMSLSKASMEWNRIGVRWCKQRSMDAVTIFNHYYGDVNSSLSSVADYFIDNIERDYFWNNYQDKHYDVCQLHNLNTSKIVHIGINKDSGQTVGIGNFLSGC